MFLQFAGLVVVGRRRRRRGWVSGGLTFGNEAKLLVHRVRALPS